MARVNKSTPPFPTLVKKENDTCLSSTAYTDLLSQAKCRSSQRLGACCDGLQESYSQLPASQLSLPMFQQKVDVEDESNECLDSANTVTQNPMGGLSVSQTCPPLGKEDDTEEEQGTFPSSTKVNISDELNFDRQSSVTAFVEQQDDEHEEESLLSSVSPGVTELADHKGEGKMNPQRPPDMPKATLRYLTP